MSKGVFLYREDSRYDDRPWAMYQFPESYLSRASQMVGDWVVYMEPVKAGRKGYHAVAKVDRITPDPSSPGMYLAIIDPSSYLDFDRNVSFQSGGDYPERSVLNEAGHVSGRAQSAVRPIPSRISTALSELASTHMTSCCLVQMHVLALSRKSKRLMNSSRTEFRCLQHAPFETEFSGRACSRPMTVAAPSRASNSSTVAVGPRSKRPTLSPCRTGGLTSFRTASLFPEQSIGCLIAGC